MASSGCLSCVNPQVTGGRNGYGAKLANIFSTEFVIETCDGKRQRQYRQVCSFCWSCMTHSVADEQGCVLTANHMPAGVPGQYGSKAGASDQGMQGI